MDRCDDRLRELRGWSQYELADTARIERSYLSRIENGHKTPSIGVHSGACSGKVEDGGVKKEILGAMAEYVQLNCRNVWPACNPTVR